MKTLTRENRIVAKAWEAAIDRKAFARTSMAHVEGADYLIEAKVGDLYDPDTAIPLYIRDLAKDIADYIVENGWGHLSMEAAAKIIMDVTEGIAPEKRPLLSESEIVFIRYSNSLLDEIKDKKVVRAPRTQALEFA